MRKPIPGFNNYYISNTGNVYTSKGSKLKLREFKNTMYVRLSKDGKGHTISVNKLLFEQFELVDKHIPLTKDEVGIRYEKSNYYFTNYLRCYNVKTKRFLKPVFRNDYVSYTLCINKKKIVVYPLTYIKKYFKESSYEY